ncbi:site-specific recombinase XerD [Maritimibacter alkaliphilus HTCC2654]|uniref:Possible phage integrase family protein n=1 Tax=Maritimibacter alkaliphilus HTCC2654 TaxID=314271 RepID=A3VEC6_9RHOB|nr:integrase [Maritimibacter alkaliphilus]EAQ13264.1 possible phage integrase family protein [Rhodobacterales bacterium HTCC2654] [Maritimibacter alkaliphilus HTCC2654]TYP85312.1 site-specific recombinase XerD [Maritimibacter alkaliphilus HTCC2654]
MAIKTRGKKLSLYRRVPKRYESVEPRKFIWLSLHTDSMSQAEAKAGPAWEQLVAGWEAKLAGDTSDAEQRFEAARELAEARGFRYMRVEKVAQLPMDELLDRIEAVPVKKGKPDLIEAAALLGGAKESEITVTRALKLYWNLAREKTLGKSADQVRKWENPRKKAIKTFITVVGDKPISEITGDDMLDFRAWWLDRIENEGLSPGSANKDLIHLGEVLKTVNKMKRLNLVLPLSDLSFKEGEAVPRPPFSDAWIRDKIMEPGALDGLNEDARFILLAMINTGARPSELAALSAPQICLDGDVPHISIEPVVRQLKSANARRVIPLCGISLTAMRARPEGFPRYWDSSASLSATVNKFLRANGLMETPKHSLYGLRHSFEDRMLAAGVDERIRRDLMGHALDRERYGKGASLTHLHSIIQPTAL